jgi:hypothetical protein
MKFAVSPPYFDFDADADGTEDRVFSLLAETMFVQVCIAYFIFALHL